MKKAFVFILSSFLLIHFCLTFAAIPGGEFTSRKPAGKPLSPLKLEFNVQGEPALGQVFTLSMHVAALVDAPNTSLRLELPAGVALVERFDDWQGDLKAGESFSRSVQARVNLPGEWMVVAQTVSQQPGGNTFGERQVWYLDVSEQKTIVSELPAALRSGEISPRTQGELRTDLPALEAPLWPVYPSGDSRLERLNQVQTPSANTITVYGYFYYKDKASVNHPIAFAKIEIYDEDAGDDTLLGTNYTNSSGYFQHTVNNDQADLADVYVKVYTQDDKTVHITDYSTTPVVYYFQTPTTNNVANGNFNIGAHTASDETTRMVWYIYDTIANLAYYYLHNQVGWDNVYNLQVRWSPTHITDPSGTHYHHGGSVDLLAGDRWDEDVILHEYGHFVMDKTYPVFPPSPNCSPHYWGQTSSDGCAWVEGWADFLQGAIQGHDDYVDTENQVIHYHLEPPVPIVDGDTDEGAVAASLWDIFDSVDESHDTFSDGLNDSGYGLWKLVYDNDPNSVYDFKDDWYTSTNGDYCAFYRILTHHEIYAFDPCSPPAPTASDGTSASEVSLTWEYHVGMTYYEVYRAATSSGSKTLLDYTAGSFYSDTTTEPGRVYYYFYRACNDMLCGDYSAYDTGWRSLAAPTGVAASDGSYTDKIRITWNSVSGATAYIVYAATAPGDTPLQLGSATTTSYDYTAPTPERPYYLWVKACNPYGCGDLSAYDSGYREMPTPVNVSASDGAYANKVAIAWSSVPGATSYKVYRGTSPGNQAYLADSSNAFYDDLTATPGQTFFYYIQASNSYGAGAQSNYNTGWRKMPQPVGLVASQGGYDVKVQLTWNNVTEAAYYELYRSAEPGGSASLLASPAFPAHDDISGEVLVHYYYTVRACNTYTCSALSNEVEGWRSLAAPPGVSASDGSYTDKVRLTFGSVSGAFQYKIYRKTGMTNPSLLDTIGSTTYDDTSATPEVIYFYFVIACNNQGCGLSSATDSGWRELVTPTGLSASDNTYAGFIRLSWNATSGANYYKVYRGTAPGSLSLLGDSSGAPFDDATAMPGTTYHYAIEACNASGCSARTSPDSGSCTIGTVQSISASDGTYSDKVRISWNSVVGATYYEVYKMIGASPSYLGQTTGLYFDYTGSYPNQLNDYFVKACNAGPCTASASDSGWRILSAPLSLTASDGAYFSAVQITWQNEDISFQWIEMYRATAPGGPWEALSSGGVVIAEQLDPTATPDTTYYYRARACNDYGCSNFSNSDSGWRENKTISVVASDGTSSGFVRIDWSSVKDAEYYNIFYTQSPGEEGSWGTTGPIYNLFFEYTSSRPGEIWYFAIQACGRDPVTWNYLCAERGPHDSGWRAVPTPANVQASDGSVSGGVQITWQSITNQYSIDYAIFRAEAPGAPKELLGWRNCSSGCNASWLDSAPPPGEVFYYWVQACRIINEQDICGEYSSANSGYTPYPVYLPLLQKGSAAVAKPDLVFLSPLLAGLALLALLMRTGGRA